MSKEQEEKPITRQDLVEVLKGMQDEFSKVMTDYERRNDEVMSARDNNIRLEIKNQLEEYKTVINAHAESIRALAQARGTAKNDLMGDIIEMIKPAIQQKLVGQEPQDDLTSQVNQLGQLTVRGTLRELLAAQKMQVRGLMKKGRLNIDEVQAAGIEGILDKSVESHGRI